MRHATISSSVSLGRFAVMATFLIATLAIVAYVCLFKIIDSDFFWHVKSGEIMWKTGALIRTEPFSYVLASKPYGALHEWLAQIVFYLIYDAGGVAASILTRAFFAMVAAGLLLFIDRRSMFPNALIVAIAFYLHRPSLMVRPQLFTFALFALSLLLTFGYAKAAEQGGIVSIVRKRMLLISMLIIQVLWVNLHGASAIFGVLCMGALFAQECVDWYRARNADREVHTQELRFRSLLFGAAFVSLLFSPNGIQTFVDMYAHSFDRTIPLVREWMPLVWHDYATDVLPFGLLAAAVLIWKRRAWVLCAVLLAATGFLSLQAYRHCPIFVFSCLGVMFFQLEGDTQWRGWIDRLYRWPLLTFVGGIALFGLIFSMMYQNDIVTVQRSNAFGFGIDIPVEGAFDFVEKQNIQGTMFNTYNEGGYLLFRGYPDRKVFADGRNIEYGYEFVQKLLDSSTNSVRWKELDERYTFTYAVVEYKSTPDYGQLLPYVTFLGNDPTWKLVYIDDWATVYVRDLPQNKAIIDNYAYRVLSPKALEFTDALEQLPADQWPQAEQELRRVMTESPRSIKPRLILASRFFEQGNLDAAATLGEEALKAQSYRPEIYELLGRISAERQDWSDAGEYLERAVALTDDQGPGINYDYLAMIFSKAGQSDKAEKYHRMALRAGQESTAIEE